MSKNTVMRSASSLKVCDTVNKMTGVLTPWLTMITVLMMQFWDKVNSFSQFHLCTSNKLFLISLNKLQTPLYIHASDSVQFAAKNLPLHTRIRQMLTLLRVWVHLCGLKYTRVCGNLLTSCPQSVLNW